MALKNVVTDGAFVLANRTGAASPHLSGPVANAGVAQAVVLGVHCSVITGTTPTLDVSLEESNDGASWTAITGSAITQLTAAGNRVAYAKVSKQYVRATATVGGTAGPAATFGADILVIP